MFRLILIVDEPSEETTNMIRFHNIAAALLLLTISIPARAEERLESIAFSKGTDGYFAFRIPSLIVSTKGTLLAFCEGRKTSFSDDGDNDLVLRRSIDGGRTWHKLQLVHDEGGDAVITIGNPCPVVDRQTGTIWLTMNRKNGRVLITQSQDEGATWAPVKDITDQASKPDWGWYALGPGVGIQIEHGPHRGRLVLPANHRLTTDRSGPSASHVIYSDDHGRTWQLGADVCLHSNECQVVETLAGKSLGAVDQCPQPLGALGREAGIGGQADHQPQRRRRPDLVRARVRLRPDRAGLSGQPDPFCLAGAGWQERAAVQQPGHH